MERRIGRWLGRYPAAEKGAPVREFAPELSYACLPLVAHGRTIASVCLAFAHARDFDANERMFLTVLAHHAAQALERSSLFEREKQTLRRIEGLQRLTATLSSAATVEGVAAVIPVPFAQAVSGDVVANSMAIPNAKGRSLARRAASRFASALRRDFFHDSASRRAIRCLFIYPSTTPLFFGDPVLFVLRLRPRTIYLRGYHLKEIEAVPP